MRRAILHHEAGSWPEDKAVAAVTLGFEDRHRRRFRFDDDRGEAFLLDLASAVVLGDNDGLALEGGGFIRVRAAAEPVADIHCVSPAHTARVAWHIGNRHTPVQVLDDGLLRIRDDHVLVEMLRGLGAEVRCHEAPFSPEPGAYAQTAQGGHTHAHR